MTIEESYSKTRIALAEIQYYIDKVNENLEIINTITIITVILSLASLLFLSYLFFLYKKQGKELKQIKEILCISESNASEENNTEVALIPPETVKESTNQDSLNTEDTK